MGVIFLILAPILAALGGWILALSLATEEEKKKMIPEMSTFFIALITGLGCGLVVGMVISPLGRPYY